MARRSSSSRSNSRRRTSAKKPRPTAAKTRRGSRSKARASALGPRLRRALAIPRNLAIGLALLSTLAYAPASVTETWPEPARQALEFVRDTHALLGEVGNELIRDSADWVSAASSERLAQGAEALSGLFDTEDAAETGTLLSDLGHWLPDAGDLLEDLLRDLLGDWLPGPRLPAGGGDLPRVAGSFASAKDLLYERVYRGHRETAYCGCDYNGRRQVDLASCGLARYAGNERARRVEAEHVFPAAQFGNFRRCWRQPETYRDCREADGDLLSGRDCCLRVDATFLVAHNDLQNLIPAVGMINGDRRDYRWGLVAGGQRYGDCGIRIDASSRRVQPPDALRGDIARIMLYMRDTYGFRLSRQDERLFQVWSERDPPDEWERRRQKRIRRLQGVENAHVMDEG